MHGIAVGNLAGNFGRETYRNRRLQLAHCQVYGGTGPTRSLGHGQVDDGEQTEKRKANDSPATVLRNRVKFSQPSRLLPAVPE